MLKLEFLWSMEAWTAGGFDFGDCAARGVLESFA